MPLLRSRPARTLTALALMSATVAACATGHNYVEPDGPRYTGGEATRTSASPAGDTLTIVSFNVRYSERVDSALAVLTSDPAVADADIVLLQEMDGEGTARMAAALGMAWVYYPASFKSRSGRDFGNAVLARWPIVDDAKVVLPHRSIFGKDQRTATAATVQVGEMPVRVYSIHLATPVNQALAERRNQMRAVLDDAAAHPRVVIGGDLNDGGFGHMATRRGYAWPTEHGPRTLLFGRWDHIFLRGLESPVENASGTVLDNRDASDHRPVWVRAVVR